MSFSVQPKNRGVVDDVSESVLPLFSERTLGRFPVAVAADLTSVLISTGIGGTTKVTRSSTQFVASTTGTGLATSPDGGDNWIVRTMPTTHPWLVGSDGGSNLLACSSNSVDTAKSTDGGVTWTASGNLPAAPHNIPENIPIEIGGRWIIMSLTNTILYTSTDHGATWSSQTLPTGNLSFMFMKVAALFWCWTSSATSYTSATALTGSWSGAGGMGTPGTVDSIWADPGTDSISVVQGSVDINRTIDGVNWVTTGVAPLINSQAAHILGGARMRLAAETAHSFIRHGEHINRTYSRNGAAADNRIATDGNGTFVIPLVGGVAQITPNSHFGAFR